MKTDLTLPPPATENAPPEKTRRLTFTSLLNVFGPFLILAFVVVLFATIIPSDVRGTFFSTYNFILILTQTVIVANVAIGLTTNSASGGLDLTVASVVASMRDWAALLNSHGQYP